MVVQVHPPEANTLGMLIISKQEKKELLSSHFYSTLSHLKLYTLSLFSNQHLSNRESRRSLTDATRKDTWLVWLCDF